MRKILQLGDPRLEKQSKDVIDIKSKEVQNLIDEMIEVLNSDPEKSAGLSAPQIGENLNIAICRMIDSKSDSDKKPNWEIMINPKITKSSKPKSVFWEGCLSIQEGNLFGKVARPETVSVKYFDREGNKKELEASDYLSHIVQHEIDHLNGVLFLKYVSDPSKLFTSEELDKLYAED